MIGLQEVERCNFCGKGNLEQTWRLDEPSTIESDETNRLHLIVDELGQNEAEISLRSIIDEMGLPDPHVIKLLEDLIISKQIGGKINLNKVTLVLKEEENVIQCRVCDNARINPEQWYECQCGSRVCNDCYDQLAMVGVAACPACGGNLELKESN